LTTTARSRVSIRTVRARRFIAEPRSGLSFHFHRCVHLSASLTLGTRPSVQLAAHALVIGRSRGAHRTR
jgi:hypothetical protein